MSFANTGKNADPIDPHDAFGDVGELLIGRRDIVIAFIEAGRR